MKDNFPKMGGVFLLKQVQIWEKSKSYFVQKQFGVGSVCLC